jgi:periplasmic protein TonB
LLSVFCKTSFKHNEKIIITEFRSLTLKLFEMKRIKESAPEFDEIIFGNRNKSYGAYDLRNRYKSVLSLSILCGITFSALLVGALALLPSEGIATPPPESVIIIMSAPVKPEVVRPVPAKPPAATISALKNLAPVITETETDISTYIPTTDEITGSVKDGNPIDTLISYIEPTDPVLPHDDIPRFSVQEMPEFPGGNQALLKFVGENLHYPDAALENNIEGRVTLKFVVNSDGSVDRIEVLGGVYPALDNEAVRIIKLLPDFKPGRQNGVPVPVWFTIPVVFKIKHN